MHLIFVSISFQVVSIRCQAVVRRAKSLHRLAGPLVPGAGPLVPGTDSKGRFASDPGRGRWCLAPIRRGDLLAILTGAIGAWHRFEGAIC
jgi:hypothetical protein